MVRLIHTHTHLVLKQKKMASEQTPRDYIMFSLRGSDGAPLDHTRHVITSRMFGATSISMDQSTQAGKLALLSTKPLVRAIIKR